MAIPLKKLTKLLGMMILVYVFLSLLTGKFNNKLYNRNPAVIGSRNCLLFVKTHKTGSSTVINLFQRYALNHDLSVALPRQDDMFLGWPRLLTDIPDIVLSLTNSTLKFDYVINHLVYKEALISPLYKEEPVRVTVVREPTEQLRSSFNYYEILKEEGNNHTSVLKRMQLFFTDPSRFDSAYYMDSWFVKSRTKSPQLADLGLEYEKLNNKNKVKQYVQKLINGFDLILVTDMMDESILLLKRLMRWELEDILYASQYSLAYPGKTTPIPDNLKSAMLHWNWGDNLLFWKAKELLFQLIAAEPRFQEELTHFKEVNANVVRHCRALLQDIPIAKLVIATTAWNSEFAVDRKYCSSLFRKERPFTRLLQTKQRPDLYNRTYYTAIEDKELMNYDHVQGVHAWPTY